jgi:hypothetical protein
MSNIEIVKLLKQMSKDLDQIKENVDTLMLTDSKSDDMYKILNAKLDLFKNLDLDSRENLADSKSDKKPTKPSFFKKIFLEEPNKYLNILYTQDEIDALYTNEEVTKKKKDSEKSNKVANLLYTTHIKSDSPAGRASAFESIYSQFYN